MTATPNFAKPSPSSGWYAVCVLLFVIPAGIGGYIFVQKLFHLTDGLVQVVVPGSTELKFDRPGVNTVFLEQESVVNGRIYSTIGSVSGLNCSLHSQDGASISLRRPTVSTTYTLQGRQGKSVLEFSVPTPGTYHFECGYEQGQSGPTVVVAVGSGVGTAIIVSLAAVFLGLGAGFAAGATAFGVIYHLQRRNKEALLRKQELHPIG